MIMCANGIPEQLFVDIFTEAVDSIKGLRGRVEFNTMTKSDHRLLSLCSEVRFPDRWKNCAETQFPLAQVVKAGFFNNPLVLDIAEIIECRALQDLKWRARVQLPSGVFLIGELAPPFHPRGLKADDQVWPTKLVCFVRARCSASIRRMRIKRR